MISPDNKNKPLTILNNNNTTNSEDLLSFEAEAKTPTSYIASDNNPFINFTVDNNTNPFREVSSNPFLSSNNPFRSEDSENNNEEKEQEIEDKDEVRVNTDLPFKYVFLCMLYCFYFFLIINSGYAIQCD